MFCNQCGAPLQPDYNLCPKCGQPLGRPAAGFRTNRFECHVHRLGILWMVVSAIFLLPSFALLGLSHAGHFISANHFPFGVFGPPVMFGFGSGLLLLTLGGICVGWGLMQREPWARVAAIVLGILVLLHPPFGTLLGIYTLWVLLSNDAASRYDNMARPR